MVSRNSNWVKGIGDDKGIEKDIKGLRKIKVVKGIESDAAVCVCTCFHLCIPVMIPLGGVSNRGPLCDPA